MKLQFSREGVKVPILGRQNREILAKERLVLTSVSCFMSVYQCFNATTIRMIFFCFLNKDGHTNLSLYQHVYVFLPSHMIQF